MLHITSSSSPVGSAIFSCIVLVVISLVVLLILRYYLPLRTTPAFYLIPIFFALWLPTIVVILVPIDLASSAVTGDEATRGIWLPERVILVSWRISYWLTFALTWYDDLLVCMACHADEQPQVHPPNFGRIFRLWIQGTIRQIHVLSSQQCAVSRHCFGVLIDRPCLLLHQIWLQGRSHQGHDHGTCILLGTDPCYLSNGSWFGVNTETPHARRKHQRTTPTTPEQGAQGLRRDGGCDCKT